MSLITGFGATFLASQFWNCHTEGKYINCICLSIHSVQEKTKQNPNRKTKLELWVIRCNSQTKRKKKRLINTTLKKFHWRTVKVMLTLWFYGVFSACCFLCQGLEVAVQLFMNLLSLCFDGCKSLRRQHALIPLMWSFNSAQWSETSFSWCCWQLNFYLKWVFTLPWD